MNWKEKVSRNLVPLLLMVVMGSVGIYHIGYEATLKNAPPCKVEGQNETRVLLLCPSLFGEVKRSVDLKTGSVTTETWLEKID